MMKDVGFENVQVDYCYLLACLVDLEDISLNDILKAILCKVFEKLNFDKSLHS